LAHYLIGTLAHFHIGSLAHYLIGTLPHWHIVTFPHWLISTLTHWHIGTFTLLSCWHKNQTRLPCNIHVLPAIAITNAAPHLHLLL